jgi:hypothetical protein
MIHSKANFPKVWTKIYHLKKSDQKNRLPWITHKIRKMFKKKQRLYKQAKRTTINTSKKKSRSKSAKLNGHIKMTSY